MKVSDAIVLLERLDPDQEVMLTFGDIPNKNINFPSMPSPSPAPWPMYIHDWDVTPYKPNVVC